MKTHSDLTSSVVAYDIIALLREPSKPRFIQKQKVNCIRDGRLTVSTKLVVWRVGKSRKNSLLAARIKATRFSKFNNVEYMLRVCMWVVLNT